MTSFTQTRRALALSATLLAAVACGNDSRQNVNVAVGSTPSKERPLGAGDVRITSTDNVLVLAVIGDTVRMQLSDSLRNTVADNVDSMRTGTCASTSRAARRTWTWTAIRETRPHLPLRTRGVSLMPCTRARGHSIAREARAILP
jgi:hypothetical protein